MSYLSHHVFWRSFLHRAHAVVPRRRWKGMGPEANETRTAGSNRSWLALPGTPCYAYRLCVLRVRPNHEAAPLCYGARQLEDLAIVLHLFDNGSSFGAHVLCHSYPGMASASHRLRACEPQTSSHLRCHNQTVA